MDIDSPDQATFKPITTNLGDGIQEEQEGEGKGKGGPGSGLSGLLSAAVQGLGSTRSRSQKRM